jgi:hypothetical protein
MIGSSETTREPPLSSSNSSSHSSFNFDDFIQHHLPSHKKAVDTSFLEWLIGFVEGDGTFCSRVVPVAKGASLRAAQAKQLEKRRFLFEICQEDPKVLHKIRKELGFGRVDSTGGEDNRHWRYRVEDRRGLQRIMSLFNGNLVLPKRRHQFAAWTKAAKSIHWPSFVLKDQSVANEDWQDPTIGTTRRANSLRRIGPVVSLDTGWLSGFLDAEGCFHAAFATPAQRYTIPYRLTQRVHITQKDVCGEREVLIEIGRLLPSESRVCLAKPPDCYQIQISSLESHRLLVEYLTRFPLRQKGIAFRQWWRVYRLRLEGRHLNEAGIRRMRRLCATIRGEGVVHTMDQELEESG